jgi:hypothetical protein
MHPEAHEFIRREVKRRGLFGLSVVEIGGRNINGSIRPLFRTSDYLSTDITDGPGVDLVADGAAPEFYGAVVSKLGGKLADVVVCCEVLEHTPAGEAIVLNAARLLGVGGVFLMTAAGNGRAPHSAVDGSSLRAHEWYRNVTSDDCARWYGVAFAGGAFVVEHDRGEEDIYVVAIKGA